MRPKQQEEQHTQSSFGHQGPLESKRNSLESKYSQTVSLTSLNCFLMVRIWRKLLMRFRSLDDWCALWLSVQITFPLDGCLWKRRAAWQWWPAKAMFALHAVCVCSMFLGLQYPWLEGSRKSSIHPNILRRSNACHHAGSFMKAIYLYLSHIY